MKYLDLFEIKKKIEIIDVGAAVITETPIYKKLIEMGLANLNAFEGDERQSDKLRNEYGNFCNRLYEL